MRGQAVDLTATECDVLRVLSNSAGRVVRHETLLRRVWAGRKSADPNLVRFIVFVLRVSALLGHVLLPTCRTATLQRAPPRFKASRERGSALRVAAYSTVRMLLA